MFGCESELLQPSHEHNNLVQFHHAAHFPQTPTYASAYPLKKKESTFSDIIEKDARKQAKSKQMYIRQASKNNRYR